MITVPRPLASALLVFLATGTAVPPAVAQDVAGPLTTAAMRCLEALDDQQRAKARHAFDSEERFNWF